MTRHAPGRLLAVLSICLVAVLPPQVRAAEPIRIGWAAWPNNERTAKIAARVLEKRMDVPVERESRCCADVSGARGRICRCHPVDMVADGA